MKGTVKWFSAQKGYGYILSNNNEEHYFNIQAVHGEQLPEAGDIVEFTAYQGNKSLNAKHIHVLTDKISATQNAVHDTSHKIKEPKVRCLSCNRKMVPMVVYEQHVVLKGTYASHSICPHCSTTYQQLEDGCFIASAIYNDRLAEDVIALRRFRDESLAQSIYGRAFIRYYYRVSPQIARKLKYMPKTKAWIKPLLAWWAENYR